MLSLNVLWDSIIFFVGSWPKPLREYSAEWRLFPLLLLLQMVSRGLKTVVGSGKSMMNNADQQQVGTVSKERSTPIFRCVSISIRAKFTDRQTNTQTHIHFVCLCMTVYEYVWLCMTMYDYVWLCMTMYGYVWLCMTIYDYVWLCMIIYDYVCLCMPMYFF